MCIRDRFYVAGTLESAPDELEATAALGKTTGRGVIQTEESVKMDEKLKAAMEEAMSKEVSSSGPSSRRISGGVTGSANAIGRGGLRSKRTMSNSTTVKTDAEEEVVRADNPPSTTRRKRVVKRNIETVPEETEEEPEPEIRGSRYETRKGPSVSDDDEFSDFSF